MYWVIDEVSVVILCLWNTVCVVFMYVEDKEDGKYRYPKVKIPLVEFLLYSSKEIKLVH